MSLSEAQKLQIVAWWHGQGHGGTHSCFGCGYPSSDEIVLEVDTVPTTIWIACGYCGHVNVLLREKFLNLDGVLM